MLRFSVLGSGSSGNATLVSSGTTHLLIDLGLSARRIAQSLTALDIDPANLHGILISHEHTDHVSGIPVLLKKLAIPVYTTPATAAAIPCNGTTVNFQPFDASQSFEIGDILVEPVAISHDAGDPCGFILSSGGVRLAHITDLGALTNLVRQRLRGLQGLVIESNHDEEMLKIGPYPWPLKQRVLSRLGHLSNRDLAVFLEEEFDGSAREIVLAHLSRQNNHPAIALMTARQALAARASGDSGQVTVTAAAHDEPTPMILLD